MATTELPASTPAKSPQGRKDASPVPATAEAADAAALFLGLLAQAAAVPTVAANVPCINASKATDTDEKSPTVDWTVPFMATLLPPPALDLELPSPDGDGGDLVALQATPAATVQTLSTGIDDLLRTRNTADTGLETPSTGTDAPDPAASAVGPRIEGNGATQTLVRHVAVPVGEPRWAEHVGHEIRILVERGVQGATLRLTPEHLGPVEVRIDMVNDKANVVFGAAQAETRAALLEAIPRLREMFASSGLMLGDAGVRQDAPGHFAGSGPRATGTDAFGGAVEAEDESALQPVRLGLVDAYA